MHLLNQMIAGAAVSSTASEPPGPSGVTWTGTSNMTAGAGYLHSDGTAADGVATSVQTINSGSVSECYFEFDGTTTAPAAYRLSLHPASGSPYSPWPSGSGTVAVGLEGGYEPYMAGVGVNFDGSFVLDTSWTATTKLRIGFDGSGHMRVWKDGTPIYTTEGTYSAEDYVLVVSTGDAESAGNGIENVIVEV